MVAEQRDSISLLLNTRMCLGRSPLEDRRFSPLTACETLMSGPCSTLKTYTEQVPKLRCCASWRDRGSTGQPEAIAGVLEGLRRWGC